MRIVRNCSSCTVAKRHKEKNGFRKSVAREVVMQYYIYRRDKLAAYQDHDVSNFLDAAPIHFSLAVPCHWMTSQTVHGSDKGSSESSSLFAPRVISHAMLEEALLVSMWCSRRMIRIGVQGEPCW